ncbi:hypothetical protein [Kineococcus sp. SYSU DK005]|uniref:hypothetical protein n=1 Tax=Kineococcus sp. SYSU DK005 TaxID=3383126 RepID=UPI003D7E9F4D
MQLDAYDIADLQELLDGGDDLSIVEERPDTAHGEPVTLIVLAVTPLVITALTLLALKHRREESYEMRAEKVQPDGSRESVTLRFKMRESTTQAEVVEQVVNGLNLDSSLLDAVKSSMVN